MVEASSIAERLPHLSLWEREQLQDLVAAQGNGDQLRYQALKDAFVEHLRRELGRYFQWCVDLDERTSLRRKFLNITGVWDVVPHDDLRRLASEMDLLVKKPMVDAVLSPWKEGPMLHEMDILAVDLKQCEPFASFLAQFEKQDGISYLDYVSGSREKRLHPYIRWICFLPKLDPYVIAKNYVSTSADPLTKTVYVAMCNNDGKRRDFMSICYELVLQTAFLDFYATWPGPFQPFRILRNMTIIAMRFLAEVLQWLDHQAAQAPDLRWLDPYLPAETFLGNLDLYRLYLENLRKVFMRANLIKLRQLNQRLGIDEDDLTISF